jgi:ArsR family transcriptional regulator
MDTNQISAVCKALGDPNRLKIIQMLSGCEKCACDILEEFNITQPTLSHHMKILSDCGLVNVRKEGKWSHYSLNCETLRTFQNFIGDLDCRIQSECSYGKCGCK